MNNNDEAEISVPTLVEPAAAARAQFLDAVAALRPRLHLFCTRMTGSVFDGEDIVQETLAEAFFKLGGLRDERRLAPWIFRIAHHKAVDFLRRRRESPLPSFVEEAEMESTPEQDIESEHAITGALATMIVHLPPKERACLVLKDVLGHSLEETAEIANSTPGGVKAALHRARSKLRSLANADNAALPSGDELRLLKAYVDCFNQHDWSGAARLLSADASLELVGYIDAKGADFITSTYFGNYNRMSQAWRFEVWQVDGSPIAMMLRERDGQWQPHTGFQLRWSSGLISGIRDYFHVPYIYAAALSCEPLNPSATEQNS